MGRQRHGAAERLVDRPNVIVIGCPNSGTSVLAEMLFELGWNSGTVQSAIAENTIIRNVNRRYGSPQKHGLVRRVIPQDKITTALNRIKRHQPWAIKDPRFCITLNQWLDTLVLYQPVVLVMLVREDIRAHIESLRRPNRLCRTKRCARRVIKIYSEAAQMQYDKWPWVKMKVTYEDIRKAVYLFDLMRQPSRLGPKRRNN